jgi:hypothetical protein
MRWAVNDGKLHEALVHGLTSDDGSRVDAPRLAVRERVDEALVHPVPHSRGERAREKEGDEQDERYDVIHVDASI